MGNNKKTSRRDAIKRMATASMSISMGLQLVGAFAPSAHAGIVASKGERFNTIGQIVSVAATVASVDSRGTYTNGCSYAGGYRDICYGKYEKED